MPKHSKSPLRSALMSEAAQIPAQIDPETLPPVLAADTSLVDDILRGAEKIGAFIGLDTRQAFHGLQQGYIPATKEGNVWVSSKTRLKEHYTQFVAYKPPPERTKGDQAA